MHRIAELLRGRIFRIIGRNVVIVRLLPIRAPMPLVLPRLCVENDHSMIAVAVGYIQLVGLLIDEQLRRPLEIIDVVAALALARLPDLHQELSILRELQYLVIAEVRRALATPRTLLVRE